MRILLGLILALIVVGLFVAGLYLQVWVIRTGLDPVRLQLQRIADEIEVRNDFDASEPEES